MWILTWCTLLLWQVRDGLNLSSCQIRGGGDLQRFVLAQGALNCVQLLIFLFLFYFYFYFFNLGFGLRELVGSCM